jgi:predicted enzyme related to lactoylglutathione lyase
MRINNLAIDANDVLALASFWAAVLDAQVATGSTDTFARIDATESTLPITVVKVPEEKSAKNRIHVDLDCDDLSSARRRLEELGASFVHEKHELGWHWATFRDPEGNEFCVAERIAVQREAIEESA